MLQEKILQTIQENELIQKNDKIVIGVSGGPDSMCLLDILYYLQNEIGYKLVVSHINHGLRPEADSETSYLENYCKEKNIPIYIKRVKLASLAKEQKIGTEEAGRNVRYAFFEEVAKKVGANKIATAHTANDNAETVLMNLLRGSAISGLKGIEIKRIKGNYTYIRPLRECSREEIENYCKQENLEPKIDKSNLENIYTRNKIRNLLIPYLQKEYNSNILETLNRLSMLAEEEEEYFSKIIQSTYETIKIGENKEEIVLDLKLFNSLEKTIKSRLLLHAISKLLGSTQGISKIHIDDILKLCQRNIGNKYLTPNKNIKIFVQKGKIFLIKQN